MYKRDKKWQNSVNWTETYQENSNKKSNKLMETETNLCKKEKRLWKRVPNYDKLGKRSHELQKKS